MKKSISYRICYAVNIFVIILLCVIMVYPYLNQLAISFNDGQDTLMGGITILPRVFTLENYKTIFKDASIIRAFGISVLRTVLNVIFAILVMFSAAYAMTRKNLKGRKFFTRLFCIPAYLTAGLIPTYILYRYLGLINSFWIYVLPFGFSFYTFVILRSFIQEIPEALEESALLDGANEITVMFKVIMPLSMPVLATVALWVAVGQWNDWTTTLYYITDTDLYPLQYVIMRIIKQGEQVKQEAILSAMGSAQNKAVTTSESVKASMLIVTSVPIIMVYPFLQKYFVKGVTLGAVKG